MATSSRRNWGQKKNRVKRAHTYAATSPNASAVALQQWYADPGNYSEMKRELFIKTEALTRSHELIAELLNEASMVTGWDDFQPRFYELIETFQISSNVLKRNLKTYVDTTSPRAQRYEVSKSLLRRSNTAPHSGDHSNAISSTEIEQTGHISDKSDDWLYAKSDDNPKPRRKKPPPPKGDPPNRDPKKRRHPKGQPTATEVKVTTNNIPKKESPKHNSVKIHPSSQCETKWSEEAAQTFKGFPGIIKALQRYSPCRFDENDLSLDHLNAAYSVLSENLGSIVNFWKCSRMVAQLMEKIISCISDVGEDSCDKSGAGTSLQIHETPGFFELSQILDFALSFDDLKSSRDLARDLTLFHHFFWKQRASEFANLNVSSLYIFASDRAPVMRQLLYQLRRLDSSVLCVTLTRLANGYLNVLKSRTFPANDSNNKLMLRGLVGVIVLLDELAGFGAFNARSGLDSAEVVNAVVRDFGAVNDGWSVRSEIACLVPALRYSTLNVYPIVRKSSVH